MSKVEQRIAEQKERAIEYYGAMPVYKYAAAFAGVTEDTLKNWRDNDPSFSDRLKIAKAEFIRKHGGKAKPEFLLERLDRDTFKENPGEVEVTHKYEELSDEELDRAIKAREDKLPGAS